MSKHERDKLTFYGTVFIFAFVGLLLLMGPCTAYAIDIDPLIRSTCKVVTSGGIRTSMGTGVAIQSDGTNLYVLSNAHNSIFGGANAKITTYWYHSGHESPAIPATLSWWSYRRNSARDLMILSIPVASFGANVPPCTPIANRAPLAGETILSTGNANGAWNTVWKGHVVKPLGAVFSFLPAPAGGRSGSAIFNSEGTAILGIIAWRTGAGQNQRGRAISAAEITGAFAGTPPGRITDTNSTRLSHHLCTLGMEACQL